VLSFPPLCPRRRVPSFKKRGPFISRIEIKPLLFFLFPKKWMEEHFFSPKPGRKRNAMILQHYPPPPPPPPIPPPFKMVYQTSPPFRRDLQRGGASSFFFPPHQIKVIGKVAWIGSPPPSSLSSKTLSRKNTRHRTPPLVSGTQFVRGSK